jgi:hypothetical protein
LAQSASTTREARNFFFFVFLFLPHLAEGAGTTREAQFVFFSFFFFILLRVAFPVNLRRGQEARSAKIFCFLAFPVNLTRGHEARSAKKIFWYFLFQLALGRRRGHGAAQRKNKKKKRFATQP